MRLTLALLASCATPALAQVPQVTTDIPAIGAIVANVMGDLGAPEVLLGQGADEHHFQLRPSQAAALERADLLVMVSPELTPWLEPVHERATTMILMELEGTVRQAFVAHEALAEEHEEHDAHEHEHEHGTSDPHGWLTPKNAILWAGVLAERLSALDPENAATYRANAAAYQTRLTALDAKIEAQLAPVKGKPFIVGHDAYGYFQTRYGLNILGAVHLGDASAGGAAHVQELSDQIKATPAACIFPEAQLDPKSADLLTRDSALRLGRPLDPSGSTLESGAGLYEALLQDMADALTECLGE